MYMDINVPKIDTIVSIIVSIASPDQIILFGSYARGDNTDRSDIDLLILKKGLKRGGDIIDAIYRAFFDHTRGKLFMARYEENKKDIIT